MKLSPLILGLGSVSISVSGFTNPSSTRNIVGIQAYLVDSSGNAKAVL